MGNANSTHDIKLKLKHSASYSNLNKKFNIYDKCNNLSNCDSIRRKKKSVSVSNLSHVNSKSSEKIALHKSLSFIGNYIEPFIVQCILVNLVFFLFFSTKRLFSGGIGPIE